METPLIDHLTNEDFQTIYEPAEDSFLLLDALESDLPFIEKQKPTFCLEIGSGSGIIITALAKQLSWIVCMATDINIHACIATRKTATHNKSKFIDVVNCNLVDVFRPNSIDLLVFNPPYVATHENELRNANTFSQITTRSLVYSWAGGKHGRHVIDKLLSNLNNIISESGVLYLLLLHENKPEEVIRNLSKLGFESHILMKRHIPGEHLYVLKAFKKL